MFERSVPLAAKIRRAGSRMPSRRAQAARVGFDAARGFGRLGVRDCVRPALPLRA